MFISGSLKKPGKRDNQKSKMLAANVKIKDTD